MSSPSHSQLEDRHQVHPPRRICVGESGTVPFLARRDDLRFRRRLLALCWHRRRACPYLWCIADALRSPAPSTRCTKTILRARSAAIAHVLSLTLLSNVVAYVCRAPLDRVGIMLARLDNLLQRHRSMTPHAAAPDVDFWNSLRAERISGRHDPCSRNSPCHARHWHIACGNCGNYRDPGGGRPALGREIGISLAEIAGITGILAAAVPRWAARLAYRLRKLRELQDPGGGRPALGHEVGISLAEIAGTTRSRQRPSRAGLEIG
jgi:hypothetical protein